MHLVERRMDKLGNNTSSEEQIGEQISKISFATHMIVLKGSTIEGRKYVCDYHYNELVDAETPIDIHSTVLPDVKILCDYC